MILDKGEVVDMIEKGKDGKLIVYGGESDWLPIVLLPTVYASILLP
jgi:hypothetical protein